MMISVCNGIHVELLDYIKQEAPSLEWTVHEIARITQHYPRGITRNILLTELESRWRLSLRRGEHSGKLRQAIQTMIMNSTDIYSGSLVKVDEYRYRLQSHDGDNTSVLLLLHRRFADFLAYVKHISSTGYLDFFAAKSVERSNTGAGRKFLCTKTRLLRSNATPIILPTEYAMFEIDANTKDDLQMLRGPFKELHRQFLRQPSTCDDQLQGCYGLVHEISDIRSYPTARARSYRLVSLQLVTLEGIEELLVGKDVSPVPLSSSAPLSAGVVFILLFDDQVYMSDLWSPRDLLYIHRPCISMNDQEPLFGMSVETQTSMGGQIVYPVVTPIKKHPRRDNNTCYSPITSGKQLNPYHLIVGAITCVSLVKKKIEGNVAYEKTGDERNCPRYQQSVISLENTLSPYSLTSAKAFFPAQKLSLFLRVLGKEHVNVRVATHSSKVKCRRRCVLWCVLSTARQIKGQMLFRLSCAADLASSVELGHIITAINAHVLASFGPNEIPMGMLSKHLRKAQSSVVDTNNSNGHFQAHLTLIAVGRPYAQEIRPFMENILTENMVFRERESAGFTHTGETMTSKHTNSENKDFESALELSTSSTFLEIAGVASAESFNIINMSRIAAFCNSPGIYPISSDDSQDMGHCGCVVGKIEWFGDTRCLKPEFLARPTSASDWEGVSHDEGGRKRKSLDVEDSLYAMSASQSIVGMMILLQGSAVSRLCLVGTNTLNMATSRIVIDEDAFIIKDSQFNLSFFVSRVDDIVASVDENCDVRVERAADNRKNFEVYGSKDTGNIARGNIDANGVKYIFDDLFEFRRRDDKSSEEVGDKHCQNLNDRLKNMKLPNVEEMVKILRSGERYMGPIYYVESIDTCVQEEVI